ncbi:zinc-binding alcohol dehydrogenase family protein [Metabacillus sp. KIGAM252]|uniref:Zinc-type alcohol dehydrogenase-like protein n=1 Tax=Metabacillus flavus TaxID=2823519 RepID=A0ABS5LD69_9BACI|nr:zinc-binding alcohol dehydrogenase family protein [Metabacillus flavus]MBS2968685.1 zinc-binding alcohol dehydrogenase family protein [Metabacillus flavus]
MKAVGLHHYLPIEKDESLVDETVNKPTPGERDILVKIRAVSVNPVDTKVRGPKEGEEEELKILGWDAAGVVEETGSGVTMFKPGDEVYYAGSIARQGTNSEYHLVDERIAALKPDRLTFEQAAAMPLTGLTAWEGMFERLGISKDANENASKSILIIGAAGGVGSIAVQLAKWAGLHVIGTASRPETEKWAKEHGADETISHYEPFKEQLEEKGLDQPDYIFCLNSTDKHWEAMMEAIAPQGKICSIVETGTPINISLLQQKSVTFVMEFMFTKSLFGTKDMQTQHEILSELAKLFDQQKLTSTLTETIEPFNAASLRKAHEKLESGKTIGKIVVSGFDSHKK